MENTTKASVFNTKKGFLHKFKMPAKISFIALGILSTAWFLFRVIPKPQRASYPCMQAAAPWASAFVVYLLSITGSAFFFKKSFAALQQRKLGWALLFLPAMLSFSLLAIYKNPEVVKAADIIGYSEIVFPASPIGEGKGKNPGRVVWVHNPHATNANMTNVEGDYWYMDKNSNEDTIKKMLDLAVINLLGETTVTNAWNELFKHYNNQIGKGNVGYTAGEKIAIKINLTNSCCGMWDTEKIEDKERMDATPQLVNALLKTLVEDLGIAESNIWCGDNYRLFRNEYWDKCHTSFPDVHYVDGHGMNDREQTVLSSSNVMVFSDGEYSSKLPQHYLNAAYFINIACLKSHDQTGISLCAKNHQGSIVQPGGNASNQYAEFMHYSMPLESPGYGKYRHLVDYMGHKQTGGKTLLYLIDGIWGGDNWAGNIFKWQMSPFNNDYPNSLFVSQDPVAIEAVCFDFLLEEYKDHPDNDVKYPYYNGVNDYLLQAADESYWPSNITYDPENDGVKIGSLGVYEHWNNGTDKAYSGSGIDFVKVPFGAQYPNGLPNNLANQSLKVYPNPFSDVLTIPTQNGQVSQQLMVYDAIGKLIYQQQVNPNNETTQWSGTDNQGNRLAVGTYIVQLRSKGAIYSTQVVLQ
ncbi:MAG: DUF362 domain-containing protein [Bacteroidota bacterium]|nr:MAG: DUF362 domain-containing protein [Bacteroidota bacterium]